MSWERDDDDDDGPYVRPRTAAGLVLVGLVVTLAVIDALSPSYAVDTITLGLLLGAGLLLLGVEGAGRLIR